jgi:putative transcriptional regulator
MSERGERIIKSLQNIIDFQNGDKTKCRVRTVTVPEIEPLAEFPKEKIREIRFKNNFTQEHFAELLGVNKKSVEAWESGARKPTGTAKRLFQLIEKDPNIINSMVRR